MKRLSIVVKGKVQGVGFRYFTEDKAAAYLLTGWVRNSRDGSVEIEAQGDSGSLTLFCGEIKEGPVAASVRDLIIGELPIVQGEKDFVVRSSFP
jgi:acylphosphatase